MRLNIASSVDCLRQTRSRQVAAPGRPSHIRESPISSNTVLPPFYLFAPIAYFLEVLTAVSLILGIFVGLWAMIGAFQIVNLWLGLYSAPGEWPWTYLFLLVLMLIFALTATAAASALTRSSLCDRDRRRPTAGSCSTQAT